MALGLGVFFSGSTELTAEEGAPELSNRSGSEEQKAIRVSNQL